MKTLKKLMLFAILALAPTAMFAADHIVFIHGYQLTGGRADTWDRMIKFMTNSVYGTPFVTADKILVVQHGDLDGQIDAVARDVWDQIKNGFPDGSCPKKMDFVVHSMGGLVLRSMVEQNLLSDSRIDRVVTLATPHYGQPKNWSPQQRNMEYGSEFIWKLATTAKKISSSKVLCVVGTQDWVVSEWSAALQDKDCASVRYVDKDHTATGDFRVGGPGIIGNDGICYCSNGRNDVVYKLVTDFLSRGIVMAGNSIGSKNAGAVLFQIVDGKGKPVPYEQMKVASEEDAIIAGMTSFAMLKKPSGGRVYAHVPSASYHLGIGSLYDISPGSYQLDVHWSKDKIFSAFTYDSIPVVRGRTSVIPIPAENVRPLDYVFLIDTTGSMGDDIASVRNDANNLIRDKLLNGARDCRVAVVDYRDFPDRTGDYDDYPYDVKCQFTSDAATAIGAINSLTLGYGGDTPETVYSGIAACIWNGGNLIGKWRPNAVKTIMIMCDAAPLDPEPHTGYTAGEVTEWVKTMKMDEEDEESGIEWRRYASKKAAALRKLAAEAGESGVIGTGVSIYPVLTSSSSSLRAAFSDIAEESGGKIVSASAYASVADAVEEVIEQSVAANGFEFEVVSVVETAGSVNVRVFGGSESDSASIGYQVVSGSGVSGTDFMAAEGVQRLTWAEGERSYKTITIPVIADASTSNDKFFSIVLCDPSGMGLGGINVCRINLLDKDNTSGEYRMGDVYVQGISRNTERGSVSGSGFCALGSIKTLTATPKSGFVFTSWENGSTASRRSIIGAEATSNAVDGVTTYVASFIPLADLPLPTVEPSGVVTGVVKEAFYWNLDYHSISEATMTWEGLPPGLVFADGVVSGTPTRTGRSSVTFTVKNAKGAITSRVELVIVRAPGTHVLAGEGTGEVLTFSQALTFTAYALSEDSGEIGGLITIKTKKERGGVAAATVTIQPAGGKKQTIKGTISTADGTGQGALAGLTFTASGVIGTLNGYSVDGAIDASKSKDAATVAVLNAFKGKSFVMALEPEAATGENAAMANGVAGFSIVFSAKGKAKVSGTMPAGTKVSVSSQLIVGSEWCCLPVVYSKTGNSLAFLLWFDREGNFDSVSGMTAWKGKGFEVKWNDEVAVSKVGNLSGTSYFHLTDTPAEIGGAEVISELLPVDVAITPAGAKWNIAKAKAVKLDRSGNLSYGANPSGLKLTYAAKTGMFKGSLSLYTMNRGRLKKNSVTISGIVVNGIGYGTATLKKVGCWPIVINGEAAKAADFKARITGVAVVDEHSYDDTFASVTFGPPETALEVPYGKIAVFRTEYDFPTGYSTYVWVRESGPAAENVGSSGSYFTRGTGVAYNFIMFREGGETCTLKSVT